MTRHDLHYTREGYQVLGTRFADKAIELGKKYDQKGTPEKGNPQG
jgi:hypothetical protein